MTWILTKDKLPPLGEDVLITINWDSDVTIAYRIDKISFRASENDNIEVNGNACIEYNRIADVIAWMELPKPADWEDDDGNKIKPW